MTEYFAVIDDMGLRRGPFDTMEEAISVLKETSQNRGHTETEAHQFFLHESAVVKVEVLNDRLDIINIGWLAREQSGMQEFATTQFAKKRDRFAVAKQGLNKLPIDP
jgi:hypothetical protein